MKISIGIIFAQNFLPRTLQRYQYLIIIVIIPESVGEGFLCGGLRLMLSILVSIIVSIYMIMSIIVSIIVSIGIDLSKQKYRIVWLI